LTERLVAQEESQWPDQAGSFTAPRPRGDRDAPADAAERLAWGEYLFDWGMEYLWSGDDLTAEACYRAALQGDPGHADAWVHIGNLRFDEGLIEEALGHYRRGEAAALERTIGNPRTYKSVFWGDLDSRPYMRALHGQGLCLWRLGRPEEARKIFRRMLRLNPSDNQGARFLVQDLDQGLSWEEMIAREERQHPGPS
jgi:tetratricopeptide (TPR) repeat protein